MGAKSAFPERHSPCQEAGKRKPLALGYKEKFIQAPSLCLCTSDAPTLQTRARNSPSSCQGEPGRALVPAKAPGDLPEHPASLRAAAGKDRTPQISPGAQEGNPQPSLSCLEANVGLGDEEPKHEAKNQQELQPWSFPHREPAASSTLSLIHQQNSPPPA